MIKKLFSLLLLITNGFCYCQSLDVTPNGLRDSSDNEKTFIVLKIDNMIAKQLYDNAIKYIHKNYKSPEDVIKGKVDGEYLKFNTFKSNFLYVNNSGANILTDAKYTTELNFKDGKVKYVFFNPDYRKRSAVKDILDNL